MKILQHKGYYGSVELSTEGNCLHGKIEFINGFITYEAENIANIEKAFKTAVNDYLKTCKQLGYKPESSYKKSFKVRVGLDLHKKALHSAKQQGINLNEFVKQSIEKSLS
jgi:predicted HicB family RNase H-like nuclease